MTFAGQRLRACVGSSTSSALRPWEDWRLRRAAHTTTIATPMPKSSGTQTTAARPTESTDAAMRAKKANAPIAQAPPCGACP